MAKIILLDSNSLVNRAFYALPPLANRKGVITNALFGYLSMLSRLITDCKPTHIAAVFDLKAPTFRHKMYEAYKGTRKPMPEDLATQIPILKELLAEAGITILQKEGYEADDIIGTIAKRFDEETIIVSGDRDVLQLVDDNTVVYNTKRGVTDVKIYDIDALEEEDFTPGKVIEYKALAGDSSDNIPGAPGVGEKTALNLLDTYGSLDGIYENLDSVKGKLQERLRDNKELVYLSKKLATINVNVPLDCELDALKFDDKLSEAFYEHLTELECIKLIPRFRAISGAPEELPFEEKPQKKVSVFEKAEITELEELNKVLASAKVVSVDFGTSIVFAVGDGKEYTIKCSETLFDFGIAYDDAVVAFKSVLESDKVVKILYDVKSKMRFLKPYGVTLLPPYEDILLKAYLCNSNFSNKTLADMLAPLGYTETIAAASIEVNLALDAELEQKNLVNLYKDIELPLEKVLFDMEEVGLTIDVKMLDALSQKYTAEIRELTERIYAEVGERFNLNSPQQLGIILFEKLGLQHGKKTKTGYSVSAEVLEELEHPVVTLILRYRQLSKLYSTYVEGMRAVMNKQTNRVHTVYKQCLTTTGRLSSTEPNLQNIPIRYEEGREIRKMLIPSAGNLLVSADYSQIELRLLAHFSGDEVLRDAYNRGEDIHALTASKIFGVPLDEVTKEMRRNAKAVNFGIIYGISAFGLAKNTGIKRWEAKEFVEKYFETYPAVKSYMDTNAEFARANGYIRTLAGRVRFFPEFHSPNANIRSFGERAAMNMPLQGSAADIVKIAMLKVARALEAGKFEAKLILQVHDELIIDCPQNEADAVKALLVENMEHAVELTVPLTVDAKVGKDWFSVE